MCQTKRRMFAAGWMLLVLAATAGILGQAAAQNPGNPGREVKRTFTNKPVFHLPVKIDDRYRSNLREMVLFMKTGQADWVRLDSLPPSGTHFTYRVPQDGEYWFTVVMIDQTGKATPPDVQQVPPGLRVVVDTQQPQLEVRGWTSAEGEVFLKCLVADANPDLNSLRLICRNEAGVEKVMESVPNLPGLIRLVPEMLTSAVRLSATDACGNQTTMDVNVRELLAGTVAGGVPGAGAAAANPVPAQPGDKVTAVSARMEPRLPPTGNLPDLAAPATNNLKQEFPNMPPAAPNDVAPPPPQAPLAPAAGNPALLPHNEAGGLPPVVPPATAPAVTPGPMSQAAVSPVRPLNQTGPDPLPGIPPAPANPLPTNRQLLNVPQASVEYRIDQVGPSGVGKVEVYLTSDGGNTWQRLREDADKRSPADIDLPGEGLFGIRLVVTNGNGFGGTPPQKGDTPTFWIEVDTTCPTVQFRPVDPNATGGALDIRWSATDKNLGAEPVSLFYRTRSDGAWQLIARNVKHGTNGAASEGQYRWNFPRDAGSQFLFKIEVVDQAGNVARAETPNAIVLDMTEPRAFVVGVTGGSGRPNNQQGN